MDAEERENQDDHDDGFGDGSGGAVGCCDVGCCDGAGGDRAGAGCAGLLLPPISAWIRARNFVISGSASGSACGVEVGARDGD